MVAGAAREGPAFVARMVAVAEVPGTSEGLDTVTEVSARGASRGTRTSAWLLAGSGSSVSAVASAGPPGSAVPGTASGATRTGTGKPCSPGAKLPVRPQVSVPATNPHGAGISGSEASTSNGPPGGTTQVTRGLSTFDGPLLVMLRLSVWVTPGTICSGLLVVRRRSFWAVS